MNNNHRKHIWKYLIILPGIFFSACNNNDPATDVKTVEKDVPVNTDKKIVSVADTFSMNQQKDSTIHFSFAADSSTLTAKGFLASSKDRITGYLPVERKASLSAQLIPADKDLNVRFSQLIMPDSTMDGPFGQKLNYRLVQKGMYKIIISPNHMADGRVKGDFEIRMEVKEK